jgi:chaperonin GroEL
MKKVYDSGQSLNAKIVSGVNKLAATVGSTLGPKGRNVIIHNKGKNPVISKDGVTVAAAIYFEDPFENVGAQVLKQATAVTATEAGDGTTTATVLANAIVNQAQRYIIAGASPTDLKRGMEKATEKLVDKLKENSKPVTSLLDVENIATISANGDNKIGKLIATAVDKVGKDGAVAIEEGKSLDTILDIVEGFQFDSGFASREFINDERRGAIKYENALILVTDHNLSSVSEMMPVLETVARENKPFIIIADPIEGELLAALILNNTRGTMRIAAIKPPRYGEERKNILKDLALATGATFVSRESGMLIRDVKRQHLGTVKTIESLKNMTTIVGGGGNYDLVEKQIEALKTEIANTSDLRECQHIQERITRLASGIAIVRVGGLTEVDMIERKHRIEDALEAVKSAQMEGILPGGGVSLLRLSRKLLEEVETLNADEQFGVQIIMKACEEPIRLLSVNCDEKPDVLINTLLNDPSIKDKFWTGWDFANRKYVDFAEEGILDPAKVTRCALQNAVSAASTLLTTSHAIIEV